MSTREEIAESINGGQYLAEVSNEIEAKAKAAGVVIVFGASDDLMEFRGAINDEVDACGGGTAFLNKDGLLTNDCDSDDCPHFEKIKARSCYVEASWDDDGYSWTYAADFPHTTFEIFDEGEKYCRGIVFNLADCASA